MTNPAAQTGCSRELAALREAVSRHHEFVYRLAFRFLKNHADAEDLTQGVFLRALRAIDQFLRVENQRAWLARVAVHMGVSWHRAATRQRKHERVWAESRILEKKGSPDMADEAIERAIAALPSDLRVPLVLHYREGLKYREIADVCGCSEGMVARRLHLAKGRLRRRLWRRMGAGGVATSGTAGFEATLRAETPVEIPAGLEGRLCESIERELAAVGRTAVRASSVQASSTAKSAWLGLKTAIFSGPVVSLCITTLMAGSIWLGLGVGRGTQTSGRPDGGIAASAAPSIAQPRPEPRRETAVRAPAAPAAEAAPEEVPDAPGKPAALFGWVRDANGKPVAGAKISLADSALDATFGSTTSNAEGYYELNGPGPGCVGTQAAGETRIGWCGQCHSGNNAIVKTIPWMQDVSFSSYGERVAGSLSKDLLAEDLQAVRPAQTQLVLAVRKQEEARRYLSGTFSSAGDELVALGAEADAKLYSYKLALTQMAFADAQGDPTRLRLWVHREGFQAAASEELDIESGGRARNDFILPQAAEISGRVLSEEGAPLTGAAVEIVAHDGDLLVPAAVSSTQAGEDGAFKLDSLPDGLYAVRVQAPGFLPLDVVLSTGDGGVQVALTRAGSLRVQVVDRGTGGPLGGYQVELHDGVAVAASAGTDGGGIAVFETLWPGEYLANVLRDGSKSKYTRGHTRVFVQSGAETSVAIEVSERARLRGWVLGPPEASPERGIKVFAAPMDGIRRSGGEVKSSVVREDGSFEVEGLPPGRYLLSAYREVQGGLSAAASASEIEIQVGQTEAHAEVRIDSDLQARLTVLILDPRGNPIAGARAALERLHLEKVDVDRAAGRSGSAALDTIAGAFRLKVSAPGYRPERIEPFVLGAGDAIERVVVMEPADPREADSSALAAEFPLCSRGPIGLRALAEMIRRLGGSEIAFDPTLEAAGVPERIAGGDRRVAPARKIFEEALKGQNLAWEARGGWIWVVPRK